MNHPNIEAALEVLRAVGMPRGQVNERSALTLLALADVRPDRSFASAQAGLLGITPIMEWISKHYGLTYAPNTRETIRRQTMHQFVAAGLTAYNPDRPDRPVNSPKAVYSLVAETVALVRQHGRRDWPEALRRYLGEQGGLATRYAKERAMSMVPVAMASGETLHLSPGAHSALIGAIIEEFAPRFTPGAELIYVGDTGQKYGYLNDDQLAKLGVVVAERGKMPDAILYFRERDWLVLAEAVTSHGPVDAKRHAELAELFGAASCGIVYVTAFPDRSTMARYLSEIAWETEVWVADAPSHLIHFDGTRFLGPYDQPA